MARGREGDGTKINHVSLTRDLKSFQPIYTDAYLYEKEIFEGVEKFGEAIFGEILNKADHMPAEWVLVLDLGNEEGPEGHVCYYYFVDCSNRSLFWLHYFDMTPFLYHLTEVKSKRRIRESDFPTPSAVAIRNPRP